MKNKTKGRVALIIVLALAIVAGVSYMPLEKWTGGRIKDFNLISDILPNLGDTTSLGDDAATIDPELLKLEQQGEIPAALHSNAHLNPQPEPEGGWSPSDSVWAYVDPDTVVKAPKPNRVGNIVAIEDYTTGTRGMSTLKAALASGRLARIAVVGDSYIEGDIFTQNLREQLQTTYGGCGVGYVNMHTDFPGFRRSVKQGGSGWTSFDPNNKKGNNLYMGLSEHYFKPKGNALSTYRGATALQHLATWNRSQFLFIAPNNTTIQVKTSGEWVTNEITGSDKVQSITVNGPTDAFEIKASDPQLIALGVWLDDSKGVSVDCMSSRGFSGITLTRVNPALCRAMSKEIDYDLIILEFGINAMSAKQTNYSVYSHRMVEVINHVRTCYPRADILLMGIGDRGEKRGGEVHSMRSCPYMVNAQREAARTAHCLFWDTREAMGGEDAIVSWAKNGKANKDYIHMTHSGGADLATLLYNAMRLSLK